MAQAGITPPATVRLICDYAEPRLSDPSARLFEPGCGDGNFLVEVLTRRLHKISHHHPIATFQSEVLLTVANLYGIDNRSIAISETRHRLQDIAVDFVRQHSQLDYRFAPILEQILEKNFLVADILQDRSKIVFSLWHKTRDFEFTMTPTAWPKDVAL